MEHIKFLPEEKKVRKNWKLFMILSYLVLPIFLTFFQKYLTYYSSENNATSFGVGQIPLGLLFYYIFVRCAYKKQGKISLYFLLSFSALSIVIVGVVSFFIIKMIPGFYYLNKFSSEFSTVLKEKAVHLGFGGFVFLSSLVISIYLFVYSKKMLRINKKYNNKCN